MAEVYGGKIICLSQAIALRHRRNFVSACFFETRGLTLPIDHHKLPTCKLLIHQLNDTCSLVNIEL